MFGGDARWREGEGFEPVTAVAAGGMALQGIGGMISAFDSGGPPMISPEIQAELEMRGIDINQYLANVQGANAFFNQDITKFPLEVQQALLDQYTKTYGGAEAGMADFAQSAFAGEDPAYLKNQMAQYGTQMGGMRDAADQRANSIIQQMGIDPSSPYAAQIRQNAQQEIDQQYSQGIASMRNQSALSNIGTAKDIVGMGMSSSRLAGAQLPEPPQTTQEQRDTAVSAARESATSPYVQRANSAQPGVSRMAPALNAVIAGLNAERRTSALYPSNTVQPQPRTVSAWSGPGLAKPQVSREEANKPGRRTGSIYA